MTGVAWYDTSGKGWLRDILVLLHLPYTGWHLSYVVIGAAMALRLDWGVLGWTVLAFFLALGIGGHSLDELNGRPLRTTRPAWQLWLAAALSIAGAVAIGVFIGLKETIWILPCIIFGGFIVFAYNLELGPKRFFHRDEWFGVAWGAFPAITAYLAQAYTISPEIVFVAGACLLYSMAQRKLSTQARFWRRKVESMDGYYYLVGDGPVVPHTLGYGTRYKITRRAIIGPAELGLKLMTWTVTLAAIGLVLTHI